MSAVSDRYTEPEDKDKMEKKTTVWEEVWLDATPGKPLLYIITRKKTNTMLFYHTELGHYGSVKNRFVTYKNRD
jgi:hypothetical protein